MSDDDQGTLHARKSCGLDEARRLSDLDPSVKAGRLAYEVFEW